MKQSTKKITITRNQNINNKCLMGLILTTVITFLIIPEISFCQEMSNQELIQELKALKKQVRILEEKLNKQEKELKKEFSQPVSDDLEIQGLPKRVRRIEEKMVQKQGGLLEKWADNITLGALMEVGAVYQDVDCHHSGCEADDDQSDISLTTVEIGMCAEVNEWINLEVVYLFEDPTFGGETSVDLDVGTINIGTTQKFPFYLKAGKMFVPFGALMTHFPDDPLIDQPVTLTFAETSEKAVLLGFEHSGIAVSGYAFNGDMDEKGSNNSIESFGVDANYTFSPEDGSLELMIGASYLSNLADSDGFEDALPDEIRHYIDGAAGYLHADYANFFLDAEYMAALDDFEPDELPDKNGDGAEPCVWNVEVGYNWNWGKNLEIALKYAGSDEAEAMGIPETRYGINFNQELFEGVIASVGYLHDEYEDGDPDDRDERDTVFGQLAVEF